MNISPRLLLGALVSALALVTGCTTSPTSTSLTSPTSGVGALGTTIASFAGTWNSSAVSGVPGLGPGGCAGLDYRVTPAADNRSGSVTFGGTCAGVSLAGSGNGTLSGDVLGWNARGTATTTGLSCPFTFDNSTATLEGTGVRVAYRGTVCGVAVSGSELLRRP